MLTRLNTKISYFHYHVYSFSLTLFLKIVLISFLCISTQEKIRLREWTNMICLWRYYAVNDRSYHVGEEQNLVGGLNRSKILDLVVPRCSIKTEIKLKFNVLSSNFRNPVLYRCNPQILQPLILSCLSRVCCSVRSWLSWHVNINTLARTREIKRSNRSVSWKSFEISRMVE